MTRVGDAGVIVSELQVVGAIPVPLKGTSCGDPAAFEAILSEGPLTAPIALGVKVTIAMQVALGASELGQLLLSLNCAAFEPVIEKEEKKITVTALLLVMVTGNCFCEFSATLPNAREVGLKLRLAEPNPVPVKATVCGEEGSESVMLIEAVSSVLSVGVNCTWKVQLDPFGSGDWQPETDIEAQKISGIRTCGRAD